MEPDTSSLIVGQAFQDRAAEGIAELHIERLDTTDSPAPVTAEFINSGLASRAAVAKRESRLGAVPGLSGPLESGAMWRARQLPRGRQWTL